MTLDEAIDHANEKAQGICRCSDDHKQLAEWLSELKEARALLARIQKAYPSGRMIEGRWYGACMCGHNEWCEVCSRSTSQSHVLNEVDTFLKGSKNVGN